MIKVRCFDVMSKILRLILICFLLFSLSCIRARPVYIEDDKKTVDRAVRAFIEEFNNENYEAIYDSADETFKAATRKEAALPLMKETRQENGKILEVTDKFIKIVAGARIQARAVYNIKCEPGERSMWFIFIMGVDGTASIAQVQSFGGFTDLSKYKNEELK